MRVLHCIHSLSGGGGKVAKDLVLELQKEQDTEVALCVFNACEEKQSERDSPAIVYSTGCNPSLRRLAEFLRFRRELTRIVRDFDPHVIHSHLWPACRLTSFINPAKVRHVWHIHDTRAWLDGSDIRSRAMRLWTGHARRRARPTLVAVSEAAKVYTAEKLGWRIGDLQVIVNGVDTQRFVPTGATHNRGSDTFVVGTAAQFRPEKGQAHLVKALSMMECCDVQVRFAGDGSTLESVKNLARQLGLAGRVEFMGHIDDVPSFLSSLDVFVLPSTGFEGMPLCILEAMAARLAVVATPIAGTVEVIKHGVNGLLVAPASAEELAKALALLHRDRDLCSRLAEQACQDARSRYDFRIVARQFSDLYRQIV